MRSQRCRPTRRRPRARSTSRCTAACRCHRRPPLRALCAKSAYPPALAHRPGRYAHRAVHHRALRRQAEFKKFEEAELARLKVDQPGLKLSQYKERVWQAWQKSPDNPMNQQ
eukprot:2565816-Prymnesium_polylepis.2